MFPVKDFLKQPAPGVFLFSRSQCNPLYNLHRSHRISQLESLRNNLRPNPSSPCQPFKTISPDNHVTKKMHTPKPRGKSTPTTLLSAFTKLSNNQLINRVLNPSGSHPPNPHPTQPQLTTANLLPPTNMPTDPPANSQDSINTPQSLPNPTPLINNPSLHD